MTTSNTEPAARHRSRARRSGMGATATYVYCAVQASATPRIARTPSGLPGLGKPRLVDAGEGLWIVVGDAPLPQYGEASIARGLQDLDWVSRCAIAHEAVVEHWIRAEAVVPMKLFTIFESDERALAYIRQQRRKLDRIIRRVGGRCEWGVRIRLASAPAPEPRARRATSGTGYLAAKKQVRDAAKEQAIRGQSRANAAFATLAANAAEAEPHPPPAGGHVQSRLLLDAAFLVPTDRVEPFRAVARRLTHDLKSEGFGLELTGPVRARSFSSGAGARLRPVNGGGAVTIVADCDERPSPTASALRKHDAVVRRIARAVPAILPVRFGTVFETDRSLIALLDAWSAELQPAIGLVERREQMTLRLFSRGAAASDASSPREVEPETGDNPGTRYLARLARAHAHAQSAPELEPLSEALAHIVAAERIARHDTGPLLLTAYHLIPRGKARVYRGILKRRVAALGLRATASGPWPPYAFVPELQP